MSEEKRTQASFQTEAELRQWLAQQPIETAAWGRGGAKTVADLWEELRSGDCLLQEKPPLRLIATVSTRLPSSAAHAEATL